MYFTKKIVELEDNSSDCLQSVLIHLQSLSKLPGLLDKAREDLLQSQKMTDKLSRELKSAKDKQETIIKKSSDKGQNLEKIEKIHVLEKVKLEHKIEQLNEELSKQSLAHKVSIEPKKEPRLQEIEEAYKSLRDKHEKSTISFYRLQMELAETKEKEKMSKVIADSYEEVRQALLIQVGTLKDRNKELENLVACFRERSSMVNEELLSFNEFKAEFYKLRNEKNIIRRKMRQLEIGVVTGGYSSQVVEEFIPANDEIFKFVQNPEKFKSKQMGSRRISTQDLARINLNTLKPCRPTFASFLKIPIGHVQFTPAYKEWLFVTIRAIFDSKYNEHLLNLQSNTLPLAFPEFVYDWLGHFTVENSTRVIKQQEWWTKNNADSCRLQLLAGLALPRSKRVWELNTFREFLQEELDLDELAFYLHSRYLLFQGPQLAISAGKYAANHYVSLEESKKLILTVMEGLPNDSISQLIKMVEEKSKKKVGFVESSFVLRVLLEFYHREKKMKYLAIQELFYRCSKTEFSFDSFKDICMSLDSKLPQYLIAKAYREAFMDGNGFISADVFYVVANNLLFYYMLRLKTPWKIPKLNEYGEIDPYFDDYSKYMATADKLFKSQSRDVEIVGKYVESMGIPEFHRQYLNLELVLNRKYLVIEEFKCWNLADVFKQYWITVLRAKSVFYEHNGVNPSGIRKKSFETMESDLKNIVDANNIFIEDLSLYQLNLIKIKILVRKLQQRAKNRPKGVSLMKNIVRTIGTLKQLTVPKQHAS